MTMSVTTPIVSATVPTDAGAPAATGGPSGAAGEFADALAGFLDGGPGTPSGETVTDGALAEEQPADTAATAADLLAATPVLWGNADLFPAAVPTIAGAGAPVADAAQVSLAAAAVSPLATTPTTAVAPAAGVVEATTTSVSAPIAGSAPATADAQGTAPTGTTPPSAPPLSVPTPAPSTPAAVSTPASGLDAQGAAEALGLTLTTANQPSTDTGADTSAGTGAGAAALASVVDPSAAAAGSEPTPVVGAGQVSGPASTTAPLAASAPAATAPRPVQVAHQFAAQVATLAGAANGVHTMTIQITPDDLGPVQVQVTLADGVVDMTVLTALEVGRDTIAQAAPDLRRYLEAAGLTCNNVEVDLSNDQSSWLTQPDADRDHEARHSSNGREQAGTPSGDIDDSPTAGAATRSPSSTSTGVDLHL